MEFRSAIESDADSIAPLHAESWQDTYRGMMPDEFLQTAIVVPNRLAAWRARLRENRAARFTYVALNIDNRAARSKRGAARMMITHHPTTGTLYFLAGRAGAGKSTFARQLSVDRHAILFCEDQWVARLFGGAKSLQEYLEHRGRIRQLLMEWVPQLLANGHSVVFDFGGNTIRDRGWVRSVFAAAGAAHELHHIVVGESLCRERVRERNRTKPEGIYWGDVSDKLLDEVNKYFQPPTSDERFTIVEHFAQE